MICGGTGVGHAGTRPFPLMRRAATWPRPFPNERCNHKQPRVDKRGRHWRGRERGTRARGARAGRVPGRTQGTTLPRSGGGLWVYGQ